MRDKRFWISVCRAISALVLRMSVRISTALRAGLSPASAVSPGLSAGTTAGAPVGAFPPSVGVEPPEGTVPVSGAAADNVGFSLPKSTGTTLASTSLLGFDSTGVLVLMGSETSGGVASVGLAGRLIRPAAIRSSLWSPSAGSETSFPVISRKISAAAFRSYGFPFSSTNTCAKSFFWASISASIRSGSVALALLNSSVKMSL